MDRWTRLTGRCSNCANTSDCCWGLRICPEENVEAEIGVERTYPFAFDIARAGTFLSAQFTCSTRPTMNTQARAPQMQIAAEMANGAKNFPVCCSTNPVSAGPLIPAKLAKPFCQPYHFPTA